MDNGIIAGLKNKNNKNKYESEIFPIREEPNYDINLLPTHKPKELGPPEWMSSYQNQFAL